MQADTQETILNHNVNDSTDYVTPFIKNVTDWQKI